MTRYLLIAIALALATDARAETFVLMPDGEVIAQTSPPADQFRDVTKMLCPCGPDCACKPGDCPGGCPLASVAADAAGHWEQRCDGKKCTLVWVPDGAAQAPTANVTSAGCSSCAAAGNATSRRRGIFPLFPNRPKLFNGRLLMGGCSSCGG